MFYKIPRIPVSLILLFIVCLSAVAYGEELLPQRIAEGLGVSADIGTRFEVLHEYEPTIADRERPAEEYLRLITKVSYAHGGGYANVWKIEFVEGYSPSGHLINVYIDSDNNMVTGRQHKRWQGFEVLWTLDNQIDDWRRVCYQWDELGNESRSMFPPVFIADGNTVYFRYDLPKKREGSHLVFRAEVVSEISGKKVDGIELKVKAKAFDHGSEKLQDELEDKVIKIDSASLNSEHLLESRDGQVYNLALLRASRLSKGNGVVDDARGDGWAVVPKVEGKALNIDGKVDEDIWKSAPKLKDFLTIYDAEVALSDTEVMLLYDNANLYIGAVCHYPYRGGPTSSENIEFLISPESSGQRYKHISINIFGGKRDIADSLAVEGEDKPWTCDVYHGEGYWSAEVVIPFEALGGEPVKGGHWRFNAIRDRTGFFPISAWIPVRQLFHNDSRTSGYFLVKEATLGDLYFQEIPRDVAMSSKGGLEDLSLEYKGYTEKYISFKSDGGIEPEDMVLRWRSPSGNITELVASNTDFSNGVVKVGFTHPPADDRGFYSLDIMVKSRDRFARLIFDREALIRAGATLQGEMVAQAGHRKAVTYSKPSEELQRLIDVIPDKTGIYFCYDPAVPGYGGQPRSLFKWDISDPYSMVGVHSGVKYPNDKYAPNGALTVRTPTGKMVKYPYYQGPDGRRCFIEPHMWWLQRDFMVDKTLKMSKSDPLGAARLLYRFAQVYPNYAATYDWTHIQYPIEIIGPPYPVSGGLWYRWWRYDLLNVVSKLANAFSEVRKTDAFQLLSTEVGEDVEHKVEYEMLRPSVEHIRTYCTSDPTSIEMNTDNVIVGLMMIGRALDEPDYVHEAIERTRLFVENQYRMDGLHRWIAISYNMQFVDRFNTTMGEAMGWSDPPGYISPRSGRNAKDLRLEEEIPLLKKLKETPQRLLYPNGKFLPIGDTWAYDGLSSGAKYGTFLLSDAGIARLERGSGKEHTQVYLTFTPNYGHNHLDPLNLVLFAEDQELLPDLGYTHTHYRAWTVSTLGHNTVTVNSSDMSASGALDGGDIQAFLPINDGLQILQARQERGYSEADEYSRQVWLIGISPKESYVVDIFRVSGGWRHEYTLQGDANNTSSFETPLGMKEYGKYLLPPGTKVIEPTGEKERGSAGGHYYAYAFVRDVKSAQIPDGKYELTLVTKEGNKARMKITGFVEPGDNTLFIGKAPSMRSTRLTGKDIASDADRFWMPKLVLRRDGDDLRSTYVTVMEPYVDKLLKKGPRLGKVEKLETPREGDVAIKVTHGKTQDYILSSSTYEEMVIGDIVFKGRMGFIREEKGKIQEMHLIGGTILKKGSVEIRGDGPIEGQILDVMRIAAGDEYNAFVTNVSIPDKVKGEHVIVDHPDGTSHGYLIADVKMEAGKSVILLDADPGFRLDDGSWEMVYFPFKRWEGGQNFRIENVVSK